MTTGGAAYYYHYDNLGSVANLTSATGTTQWTETYEPFGTKSGTCSFPDKPSEQEQDD